jgi:hypothetical protein
MTLIEETIRRTGVNDMRSCFGMQENEPTGIVIDFPNTVTRRQADAIKARLEQLGVASGHFRVSPCDEPRPGTISYDLDLSSLKAAPPQIDDDGGNCWLCDTDHDGPDSDPECPRKILTELCEDAEVATMHVTDADGNLIPLYLPAGEHEGPTMYDVEGEEPFEHDENAAALRRGWTPEQLADFDRMQKAKAGIAKQIGQPVQHHVMHLKLNLYAAGGLFGAVAGMCLARMLDTGPATVLTIIFLIAAFVSARL